MPTTVWTGQVSASFESVLYIGPLSNADFHHHPGHQVYISMDGPIEFRTSPDEPWATYSGVIIRSDHPHAMRDNGTSAAMLLIEPMDAGHVEMETFLQHKTINALPENVALRFKDMLNEMPPAPYSEEQLLRIKHILMSLLKLSPEPPENFDERIAKAQALIQEEPGHPWTVKELAARVDMSIRHFRHVFGKQVGVSPSRYIKWARVMIAAKKILTEGVSIGQASKLCGFADAGHLTRSFRELTGSLPTSISKTLEAHFTEDDENFNP